MSDKWETYTSFHFTLFFTNLNCHFTACNQFKSTASSSSKSISPVDDYSPFSGSQLLVISTLIGDQILLRITVDVELPTHSRKAVGNSSGKMGEDPATVRQIGLLNPPSIPTPIRRAKTLAKTSTSTIRIAIWRIPTSRFPLQPTPRHPQHFTMMFPKRPISITYLR